MGFTISTGLKSLLEALIYAIPPGSSVSSDLSDLSSSGSEISNVFFPEEVSF